MSNKNNKLNILNLEYWANGKSNIKFENVNLPDYSDVFEAIDTGCLIGYVKELVYDEVNNDESCKEAIPFMQYLHNQGVFYFDYDLALFYLEGKIIKKDGALAIELLKGLASEPYNDAMSMRKLGDCYQYGDGTAINPREAIKWYESGAVYGDELAALNAGVIYARGLGEIKPNFKKSKLYLRQIKDNKEYKKIAKEWLFNIAKMIP